MRPKQVRDVPPKASSVRGYIPALKPWLPKECDRVLNYESALERDFYACLDHDPFCLDMASQPAQIDYTTHGGQKASIYPDTWAIYIDMEGATRKYCFEVKPESKVARLKQDPNYDLRQEAISNYCSQFGWEYRLVTERWFRSVRQSNITALLQAAKHFGPVNQGDIGPFNSLLRETLEQSDTSFMELAGYLAGRCPLTLGEVISLLKYKIYYFLGAYIDWDVPFGPETMVSGTMRLPKPLVDVPPSPPKKGLGGTMGALPAEYRVRELGGKDLEEYERRWDVIRPIIELHGREAKKGTIRRWCGENGQPFAPTYRYYRRWYNGQKEALIPRRTYQTGRRRHRCRWPPRVKELLEKSISEWNAGDGGPYKTMKVAYGEFKKDCKAEGLTAPCYQTYRNWAKKVPAALRRGKYRPRGQVWIPKGVRGTYRGGRPGPGAVIQMDHTLADIQLVDPLLGDWAGRPWVTGAYDVNSQSIWSTHVSLHQPNAESVAHTILDGAFSKDHSALIRFAKETDEDAACDLEGRLPTCAGLPAMVSVDNAMEFRAESLRDLCMGLNITLEYRPVRTPAYGGAIESWWNTLNEGIRSSLPGATIPTLKERDTASRRVIKDVLGYRAKQAARLTLEEFERWVELLVAEFSETPRTGQLLAPARQWEAGLTGDQGLPMGGALRTLTPGEYWYWKIRAAKRYKRTLSRTGFQIENILYSAEWLDVARYTHELEDHAEYEVRVSRRDVRYAYLTMPDTGEVRELVAYKHKGDRRIQKLLDMSLGEVPGHEEFPLSRTLIKAVKNALEPHSHAQAGDSSLWDALEEALLKGGRSGPARRAIREMNLIETPQKAVVLTQMGVMDEEKLNRLVELVGEGPAPVPTGPPSGLPRPEEGEEDEYDVPAAPTSFEEVAEQISFLGISRRGRDRD